MLRTHQNSIVLKSRLIAGQRHLKRLVAPDSVGREFIELHLT